MTKKPSHKAPKQQSIRRIKKLPASVQAAMRFHIISLFPSTIEGYVSESILKRAIEDSHIEVYTYNPKQYPDTPKDRIDKKPYGGGPGMVIQAAPVLRAYDAAIKHIQKLVKKNKKHKKARVLTLFFTPHGTQFDTETASTFASSYTDIIMICGRYEGIDARVRNIVQAQEYSVGPYVLTGGEIPAMIVIDAVSRQVPGVLGDFTSREESRIASDEVYTRPEKLVWKKKKYTVPPVLLSGNHKKIDEWRADH